MVNYTLYKLALKLFTAIKNKLFLNSTPYLTKEKNFVPVQGLEIK